MTCVKYGIEIINKQDPHPCHIIVGFSKTKTIFVLECFVSVARIPLMGELLLAQLDVGQVYLYPRAVCEKFNITYSCLS